MVGLGYNFADDFSIVNTAHNQATLRNMINNDLTQQK